MGCGTFGYGVAIEQLKAVRGCRDASLLSALEQKFADRLERAEDENTSLWTPPFSLRMALGKIVNDEISDTSPDAAAQYIYAYELLCEHFGQRLDGDSHIEMLDDLGWETAALEFRTPLDLPDPLGFPSTSYLTREQVNEEYDQYQDVDTDEDDPVVADAREEFVWWLKQCADQGLGLVTFCY